ncbi:MAG: TIGR01459 family HAD-type hydrolase [Hyphomicrobium sp.]
MSRSPCDVPELTSIAPLAAESDVWFVDIWGVLHNGMQPYPQCVEACRTFRNRGGVVILVSNSPRPSGGVIRQLEHVGVPTNSYDDIVTSGDVTRGLLAAWAGRSIRHIGPDRDLPLYDGFHLLRTSAEAADIAVCTGLVDDETETPADYASELALLKSRGLTMICANPDVTVERGGRIIYCAGALAAAYQMLGGAVLTAGKPHAPIYDAAMLAAAAAGGRDVDKTRILAIGDGVKTDIAGARAYGLKSVFIASAVDVNPGEALSDAAHRLFAGADPAPVGVMRALAW